MDRDTRKILFYRAVDKLYFCPDRVNKIKRKFPGAAVTFYVRLLLPPTHIAEMGKHRGRKKKKRTRKKENDSLVSVCADASSKKKPATYSQMETWLFRISYSYGDQV